MSRLCGAVGGVLRGGSIFLLLDVEEEWWRLKPRLLLDLNDNALNHSLNCDRYCLRCINRDVQVHPPSRLYKLPSSSCLGCQFTLRYSYSGDLSLSPFVCCFFSHSHRLHSAHGTGESRASGTSSCCWDPARDRRTIRFLGSVFTRLLAPVRLLPLRRLRTNDYFIYSGSSLRPSAYIDLERLHRLRSLYNEWYRKVGWRRHPTFHRVLPRTSIHVY
jgi:hypothetical protein